MRSTIGTYIDRFRHDRHERLMLGFVLLILATVVALAVYWQLRYVGITMTNETFCGYEEHTHTEECYEYTLICGLEETEGHTHTDECYEEQVVLVCGLEESEEHTHTDECYETQSALICELEECEPHTHTEECYEKTLICELEEHTHTAACLIDLTADVEDESVWEATLPELTGDLRTDIVAIAGSQLGYTESTANYTLGDDDTTHYGYTRYGARYGNAYGDWDAMFVTFCLDYGGMPDDFTYNSGTYAWTVELAELGYYLSADSYVPSAGDVAFIDTDADDKADVCAIVVSIDESSITVIQGNYTVTDSETGESSDTVAYVTYSTASTAEGEIVTLSAESESADITPVVLGYLNVSPDTASAEVEETVSDDSADSDAEPEAETEIEVEIASEETADEVYAVETDSEESEVAANEVIIVEETSEEASDDEGVATTDYVTEVTELYTKAMSLTAGDTETAAAVWTELMEIWEQIYAEEDAGTLTLTDEEYDNIDSLTDEVYYYFVETVGYDPYGVATADDSNTITVGSSTYADLSSYATITWAENSTPYYSSSDEYIHVPLIFTFSGLTSDEITSNNYTFYLALPDGVTPGTVVGETDTSKWYQSSVGSSIDFIYMFFYDDTTGTYYIEIIFDEDDVYQDTIYDGYVSFEAIYSDTDENDQIVIEYSDSNKIVIDGSDITTEGNESWNADINVSKSASSYDVSTNSITYTVIVYSLTGTDSKDITLSDLLTLSGSGLTEEDITGITVDSVESTTIMLVDYNGYTTPVYGTYTDASDSVKSSSTSDNGLSLTLAGSDSGIAYKITYTVTFDPESSEIAATLTNTATASVDDKNISDTVTYSKYVSTSVVDKSGRYDGDETISWTITVNPYNSDIAGYIFYDDMFADAENLTVSSTTTTPVKDTDWKYVYDDTSGEIIGIQFLGDSNGENTNSYTITYTTSVSVGLGETVSVTNEVTVTDGEDPETEITTDSTTVSGSKSEGNGEVTKMFTGTGSTSSVTNGTTTNTYVELNWTSTITIPEDGISAGTEIYDYIGTYSGDTQSYTFGIGSTYQWFTYDQITAFFATLENGITIGTYTIPSTSYTLYAYDISSGKWVSSSDLVSDDLYTAFEILFTEDVEYSGDIILEYTTTANTTNVTTSRTYWNTVKTGSLSSSDSHTEYNSVYKADGNGNAGTTYHTTSTGVVTWKVYVRIDDTTSGDITIVDTIPYGITLDSATVSYETTDISYITGDSSNWTSSNSSINVSQNNQDVTIEIPETLYKTYATSTGGYLIVTYTCSIYDFDPDVTYNETSFTNEATVTIGTASVEVDQTQKISHTVTGTNDDDTVVKGYTYDSDNNILDFNVVINLEGEDLVKDSDTLEFKDELQANYGASYTFGQVVSLRSNSVKFYELVKLYDFDGTYYYVSGYNADETPIYTEFTTSYTSSDLYIADDGTVYYKKLLDIDWTYDETYAIYSGERTDVTHTISATIPDSTAIYVEYSYSVIKSYESPFNGALYNTASVTGHTSNKVTPNDDYKKSTTSGSVSTSGSLTLIKVDGNSFSTTIPDATFEIYYYDTSTKTFKSTEKTVTTGSNGSVTITMENMGLNVNTLYYLVETIAPEGYILDTSTRYYFYWVDETASSYEDFPSSTDLLAITGGSFTAILSDYSSTAYAKNYESTTTTLGVLKTDSTDTDDDDTRLSGATYKLQMYDATDGWIDVEDSDGDVITYTTSSHGRFYVDFDGLTYNQAYRLVETAYPDGYEVGEDDQNEIYFCWSYSDTTTYPEVYPSGWAATSTGTGATVGTAIDLADSSVIAEVTNTPIPTTSVTVKKSWVNDSGTATEPVSGAYANVQLYYYLGDTIEVDTGGTSSGIPIYFGGSSLGWEQTLDNVSGVPSCYLTDGQTYTITINVTSSAWFNLTTYSYTYTEYYTDWWCYISTNVDSGSSSSPYTVTFTASDSVDLYQVVANANGAYTIDSIVVSYTDSTTSVEYTNTYSNDEWTGWVTAGGTGGGAGGGTTDTYTSSDLPTGTLYSDTVYTISASTGTDGWSYTVDNLPQYVYTTDSEGKLVKQYYYYYFVEVEAKGADVDDATYSTADGVTDSTTPITITNTVSEESESFELPSTGGGDYTILYEFGVMLILLALTGACAYRNISQIRETLVREPSREQAPLGCRRDEKPPDVRNRKFVIIRNIRKGESRAGPEG